MGKVYRLKVCRVSFKFFFFFNFCFTFVETGSGDVVQACLEFMIPLHQPLGTGSLTSNGYNIATTFIYKAIAGKSARKTFGFRVNKTRVIST